MKIIYRLFIFIVLVSILVGVIPDLRFSANAASTMIPILSIDPTSAVNPVLDHILEYETYGSGGPFTISWEWKADLKPNDPADTQACRGGVSVVGTINGSTTKQQSDANFSGYNPPMITGTTDWKKESFMFQNVGIYSVGGSNVPGNILRFFTWKAKGQLQIKNLVIKNAKGNVVYNLNTDSIVLQAIHLAAECGMSSCDLSELAYIDYENCPWTDGQFSIGSYTANIMYEYSAAATTTVTTTSSTTKRTTVSTTRPSSATTRTTASTTTMKPSTAPPFTYTSTRGTTGSTTNYPTSKATTTKPTTIKPTTAKTQSNPCVYGHRYQNGFCIYCAKQDPNWFPCINGHTFQNGWCIYCLAMDPYYDPCASGHTYENGWCIYCLDPDPFGCHRGEHNYSGGYCVNCFTADPNYQDPCANGHLLDNSGQCVNCSYYDPNYMPTQKPAESTSSDRFPDQYYPTNPTVDNDRVEVEDDDDDDVDDFSDRGDDDFFLDEELMIKIGILAAGVLFFGGGFVLVLIWIKKKF